MKTPALFCALCTLFIGLNLCSSPGTLRGASRSASYTILDLGSAGAVSSEAAAINSKGDVVGHVTDTAGRDHAFGYIGGKAKILTAAGGAESRATGINDLGQMCGWYDTAEGDRRGFRLTGDKRTTLHAFEGKDTWATGINAKSQVCGGTFTHGEDGYAFIFTGGFAKLPTLGGLVSQAYAINRSGQAAGATQTPAGSDRAFLYNSGKLINLGQGNVAMVIATAINDRAEVAGAAFVPGKKVRRAALRANGKQVFLGTLPKFESSVALGINNRSEVVGRCFNEGKDETAFLYRGGRMIDLNTLVPKSQKWVLTEARAINDRGQICGTGLHDGKTRAFLLSPRGVR